MESDLVLKKVLGILEERQADEVVVIDVKGRSDVVDYFVVASGKSSSHMRALFSYLKTAVRQEFHIQPFWQEDDGASWIVLDVGSIIIHLFEPRRRAFYNLEEVWSSK